MREIPMWGIAPINRRFAAERMKFFTTKDTKNTKVFPL